MHKMRVGLYVLTLVGRLIYAILRLCLRGIGRAVRNPSLLAYLVDVGVYAFVLSVIGFTLFLLWGLRQPRATIVLNEPLKVTLTQPLPQLPPLQVVVQTPTPNTPKRAKDFDEARKWHEEGKAVCIGYPAVKATDVRGNTLVILVGSDETATYAHVYFRETDVWPVNIIIGVPLLVCYDPEWRVIWVGHAGFDGQRYWYQQGQGWRG